MKTTLLYILFALIGISSIAQESTTLVFTISNQGTTPLDKVQLKILNQSYTLTPGNPLSIKVTPNYKAPLEVVCKSSSVEEVSYFFIPSPAQNYEFTISNAYGILSITLKNVELVKLGLLEGVNEAAIAEQQKKQETVMVSRNNMGIAYNVEKEGATNSIREEWLHRGGKITYLTVGGMGSYFRLKTDYGTMNGFGGGVSAAVNRINLAIPEYKPGTSKWSSFNLGVGMDLQIYSYSFSMSTPISKMDQKISNVDMLITGNIGYTWGFGKFIDEATWKGFAITAKYRPSLGITSSFSETTYITDIMGVQDKKTTSGSDTKSTFNAGGFGFDLDFNSFSAKMQRIAPKPSSKFSFFLLPPIGDNPLFITISYGLTFYTK